MSDDKLRCCLVYRLESGGSAVCVAKYDHAGQYETHGGSNSALYGGRDKAFSEAVAGVISNDPPTGVSGSGKIGGFKVVQSDQHQVTYGSDSDGLCESFFRCSKRLRISDIPRFTNTHSNTHSNTHTHIHLVCFVFFQAAL
jgi:hypothetical protein